MKIIAQRVLAVAAALSALSFGHAAQAAWPEKPIKLVLPFGPGGVADVTSRIMADTRAGVSRRKGRGRSSYACSSPPFSPAGTVRGAAVLASGRR